jgi:outer membrane lipoprotein LolB
VSTSPTGSRLYAFLLLAALVAGCAYTPRQEAHGGPDWETHRSALADLDTWSFSGRVAVKTPRGADTARLSWRQQADDLEMTLSGPVGFKQATLVRENDVLSLLRNGERQPVDPRDDAIEREFGWRMPLDYLPWWLRGLPAPQLPAVRREIASGRLQLLEQAGWTVEYPDYQWVEGRQLPRTIRFRRDGVEGKILLKEWVLGL